MSWIIIKDGTSFLCVVSDACSMRREDAKEAETRFSGHEISILEILCLKGIEFVCHGKLESKLVNYKLNKFWNRRIKIIN